MLATIPTLEQQQPVRLSNLTAEGLLEYFRNSWAIYDWLFSSIKEPATYYTAPDPLRNPLIFYWGHTAAFYINKMVAVGLLEKGINAEYEVLFARGVDPDLPENLEVQDLWPSLEDVDAYREAVKQVVERCIATQQYPAEIDDQHPLWAILMGVEHDRIHFETSSVLLRQVPAQDLQRPQGWKYAYSEGLPPDNQLLTVAGGTVTLGKKAHSNIYGWDNEYGQLEQTVAPFEASQNLISNQDYLLFYDSGAYQERQYWTEEGWAWKQRTNTQHPKFWVPSDKGFLYRAMFEEQLMPLDYPVEVNCHEAWAYCAWVGQGFRLMAEAEFQLLAQRELEERDCAFATCYNLNLKFGSPNPVGSLPKQQSALEFNDLFGNVWEWLRDDFYPLPGYKVHALYDDFSAPYFDSDHSMLAGGAWATTGTGASRYYRLWFRRHFYQHAGFRLARDKQ
jgi:5-histidylcysteine sulfoxide synthase